MKMKFNNKKWFTLRKSKGFTLVELLLYMGIFSILLTVTLQMFSSIFEVQLESQATSSVAADGKLVINRFTYDLNRAQSITVPAAQGTTSPTLSVVINSQTFTYSLVNGNLILQNSTTGTSDQLNSNETKVSGVSFIKLNGGGGKDVIQFSFTLTSEVTSQQGKEVISFQTSAGLR